MHQQLPITLPPIFVSKHKTYTGEQIKEGNVFFPDGLGGKTLGGYIDAELQEGFPIYDKHLNFLVIKAGYIIPYDDTTKKISVTYSPDYKVYKAIGGKSSEAPLIELLADAINGKYQKELMHLIMKSDVRSNDHIAKELQHVAATQGKQIVIKRLGLDNTSKREITKARVGLLPHEKLPLDVILSFDHESHKVAVIRETKEETGHDIEEKSLIPFVRIPEIKSTPRGRHYIKDRVYYIGSLGPKVQEPKLSLSELDQHLCLEEGFTLDQVIQQQQEGICMKYGVTPYNRLTPQQQKKKLSTGVANYLAFLVLQHLIDSASLSSYLDHLSYRSAS